jgi:RNA-dependent RNA polymerase
MSDIPDAVRRRSKKKLRRRRKKRPESKVEAEEDHGMVIELFGTGNYEEAKQELDEAYQLQQDHDKLEAERKSSSDYAALFVTNLPFKVGAVTLVELFKMHASKHGVTGDIVSCRIIKKNKPGDRFHGTSAGKAELVGNKELVTFLESSNGKISIQDRNVHIRRSRNAAVGNDQLFMRDRDDCRVSQIQFGNFVREKKSTVFYEGQSINDLIGSSVFVRDDDSGKPCIAIMLADEGTTAHSIEFRIRNCLNIRLEQIKDSKRVALSFSFHVSPRIYVGKQIERGDFFFFSKTSSCFGYDLQQITRISSDELGMDLSKVGSVRIILYSASQEFLSELNSCLPRKLHWNMLEQVEIRKPSDFIVESSPCLDKLFSQQFYSVRYLLHSLVCENKLIESEIPQVLQVLKDDSEIVQSETLFYLTKDTWYRRQDFDIVNFLREALEEVKETVVEEEVEEFLDWIFIGSLEITPSKVRVRPPVWTNTNRVIRHYWDERHRFLPVTFVDEDGGQISLEASSSDSIKQRIANLLKFGVNVGGRKFYFLSYSSSQLKRHSCWLYSPTHDGDRAPPTADDVRKWMGNFSGIKTVSKYGARLGQCFSDTKETLVLSSSEISRLSDVESATGKFFSDGVGRISESKAKEICQNLGIFDGSVVSAFQIRFGGAKGVLSVCPDSMLSSFHIALRPSMIKFQSEHRKLEICSTSKKIPTFLNRQLITLLSTLGIRDEIFVEMAKDSIALLDSLFKSRGPALSCLKQFGIGTSRRAKSVEGISMNVAFNLLESGFEPKEGGFLLNLLLSFRDRCLMDIRHRARIPVLKSATCIGILDEFGILQENQIFLRCTGIDTASPSRSDVLVKKKVIVGRNPSLHPGDLRILEAVDCPQLRYLENVVVFPQYGRRPLPDQMSGGDLDGDIYFVIWDDDLIPASVDPPASYESAPLPLEMRLEALFRPMNQDNKDLKLDAEAVNFHVDDVIKWFVKFIGNDNLGQICNAHLAQADQSETSARDSACIELARLASYAVDFPKTGIPAEFPLKLRPQSYPDFMEHPHKSQHESQKALGKVYRLSCSSFPKPLAVPMDLDWLLDGDTVEEFMEDAREAYYHYRKEIGRIMKRFHLHNEGEMWSGFICNFSKRSRHPGRDHDIQERLNAQLQQLKHKFRDWFFDDVKDSEDEDSQVSSPIYGAKASAWFKVTLEQHHFNSSFPWVVHDVLCALKRSKQAPDVELKEV